MGSITYTNLITDIGSSKIKNLYLFYGFETLLINDAVLKICERFVSPGFKNINFLKFEGPVLDREELINACETLPFMDERKIILVRGCSLFKSSKSGKDGDEENDNGGICEYLERLPGTVILILISDEGVDKRKKLYNTIKKYGDTVEFNQLKGQELLKWVYNEFKQYGKTICSGDVQYLISRINGSLEYIKNEVNKLVYYSGDRVEVSSKDIDAVVPKSLETNIFQLVDMISGKNPGAALLLLNELILESEPPAMILFMISRQYRLILNTKLYSMKGYSSQEIMNSLGVQPFVYTKLSSLAKQYTEEQLLEKLSHCLEVDGIIKKGKMDPRFALESLIVRFSK